MRISIKIFLLIVAPFMLLFIYKYLACLLSDVQDSFDMICFSEWKTGLIICIIFVVYSLHQMIIQFSNNLYLKWTFILVTYILVFGIIALPYMIVSFVNIEFSGFLHFIPILLSLDLFSRWLEKRAQKLSI